MSTHTSDPRRIPVLSPVNRIAARAVDVTVVLLMFVMLVLLLQQAIGRYAFSYAPAWIGEIARYAFVWVTFLGIAATFRRGQHVSMAFLLDRFSVQTRRILRIPVHVATLAVLLAMTWGGIKLTTVFVGQASPAIEISMAWVFSSVAVAGIAMLLFEVEALVMELRCGRPEPWAP
jgi:TRAP-type C4-dicarboxylate transport system permease small subunit